jgi:hypothetical protein
MINIQGELNVLLQWLIDHAKIDGKRYYEILPIAIRFDARLDKANKKNSRSFCAVDLGKPHLIYTAKAIEKLPVENRIGILLHELGHIVLDSTDEVAVDQWCYDAEVGFFYCIDVKVGRRVIKNLEEVSYAFTRKILP